MSAPDVRERLEAIKKRHDTCVCSEVIQDLVKAIIGAYDAPRLMGWSEHEPRDAYDLGRRDAMHDIRLLIGNCVEGLE